MPEPIANVPNQLPGEPELTKRAVEPKGVLQKNLKPMLYLGAALLVIVAAIFSGTGKKTPTQKGGTPNQPPQPTLQDSTDNNVQDLKNQVAAAQQKAAQQAANPADPSLAAATPAQQAAAQAYGPNGQPVPCVPGQPCAQGQQQLSPAAQEEQQLAAKDRELAFDSRFASNIVFARTPDPPQQPQTAQAASSFIAPHAAGDPPAAPAAQSAAERRPEVNIDAATGQPYVIYEGTTLDTVLMNRLDGDAAGPVKVLVSNPVYSHDRQHVLIPEGTIVLGEAKKIGSAGLGQQRRMAEYSFSREPQIFSVSARQALEGKVSRRDELVGASGIHQFEEALLNFLIEERAEAFLVTMHERISAFLAQRRRLETVAENQKNLEGLSERLPGVRVPGADLSVDVAVPPRMDANRGIGVALEKRTGCWVCGQVLEAIFRFLSKHQYQLTIDRKAQQEHAERGGFCSLHTWQYENISSPYGVCASYPVLAHRIASELQKIASDPDGALSTFERVNKLPASKRTCHVCQVRVAAERHAIDEAAARVREVSRLSSGTVPACCLVHLAMLSGVLGESESARFLLGVHAQFLERLGEDAQRYALRHDALRRYLTSEEERRASQLLLLMLAGHRNVSAPWQVEYLL